MAILHRICAAYMDATSEIADFDASLAKITKDFDDGLRDLEASVDLDSLNKKIDTTLGVLDRYYGADAGSNAAMAGMAEAGIHAGSDEATQRALEKKGFINSGTRYWSCNSESSRHRVSRTVSGIGAGYGDGPATASAILGKTIADPSDAVISGMLARASVAGSSVSENKSNSESCTGFRANAGNIDSLRELAKGCGSTANLHLFLKTAHFVGGGFGVVYSTAVTQTVLRPASVPASTFNTVAHIRSLFESVLFDDDIQFTTNDICHVRTEVLLGYSWESIDTIRQRLRELASDLSRPIETLSLIRRAVRFPDNETVVGNCPVIRSRSCRPEALTADKFTIGLSVNGIYRVIDVTGDRGSFAIRDSYSVSDIVTNINKVFGDLLTCEVSGSEFWMRLRDGFGTTGSVTLFWSGDTDCSHLIGLDNACLDALRGTSKAFSLKSTGEVTWRGGGVSATSTTSPLSLLALTQIPGALTQAQGDALLVPGTSYWESLPDSSSLVDSVEALIYGCESAAKSKTAGASGTVVPESMTHALAQYESELVFCDVTNTGYFDTEILFGGFGVTGMDAVLRLKPWIWNIDPYQSEASVLAQLQLAIKEIMAAGGITATDLDYMSITTPLSLNYAAAAQLRLQHDIVAYASDFESLPEARAALIGLCAYTSAVATAISVTPSVTKSTTSDQTGTVAVAGINMTTMAQVQAAKVDMTQMIWDALSEDIADKLSALALAKAQSVLDDSVSIVEDVAGYIEAGLLSGIRDAADFVGDLLGGTSLSSIQKQALSALIRANKALATASEIAIKMNARYASLMAKAESLSNFAINFSGSLGFKSKYVTCVATGSVSAIQLDLLAKFLSAINELADQLNKLLKKLHDLLEMALDKIVCMIDKIMGGLTGTVQYEAVVQRGAVTATLQCTATVSLAADFDPGVLFQITELRSRVLFLIDCMKLQLVTFKAHTANFDATKSAFSGSLADTLTNLLSQFAKC